jgi:hypothetical protein
MYYVDYRLVKILSQERLEEARRLHRRKRRSPVQHPEVAEQVTQEVSAAEKTKAA